MAGTLYVGSSGFAYPGWSPAFYPRGTRSGEMLGFYAQRLNAVELNNTYYQQPSPERIASWLASTPGDFRFSVKAQRGGSGWAFTRDPRSTLAWLTRPFRDFGTRLGAVLFRVVVAREPADGRLDRLLDAWPAELPLALEFQHSSWHVDDVFETLRARNAALCVTDLPAGDEPTLRATCPFVYLRLRRDDYAPADLTKWAERLRPFLDDGRDAYVFFKHDEHGRAPELAAALRDAIGKTST
jgi:uncharacterized protein YecE (DUF72 family)